MNRINVNKSCILGLFLIVCASISYSQSELAKAVEKAAFTDVKITSLSIPKIRYMGDPLRSYQGWNKQIISERYHAANFINAYKDVSSLTAVGKLEVAKQLSFVENKFLIGALEEKLNANDILGIRNILGEYYTLSSGDGNMFLLNAPIGQDIFVERAVAYMKKYPHQIPIVVRAILKNPELPVELKKEIQFFIKKDEIIRGEELHLAALLRSAYLMQEDIIRESSLELQRTIADHQLIQNELEEFMTKYKRQPRWNGLKDERKLYNQIWTHIKRTHALSCEVTFAEKLKNILNTYPKRFYTEEETISKLMDFINEHHFLPRIVQDTTAEIGEEELILEDSISHWLLESEKFHVAYSSVLKDLNN